MKQAWIHFERITTQRATVSMVQNKQVEQINDVVINLETLHCHLPTSLFFFKFCDVIFLHSTFQEKNHSTKEHCNPLISFFLKSQGFVTWMALISKLTVNSIDNALLTFYCASFSCLKLLTIMVMTRTLFSTFILVIQVPQQVPLIDWLLADSPDSPVLQHHRLVLLEDPQYLVLLAIPPYWISLDEVWRRPRQM